MPDGSGVNFLRLANLPGPSPRQQPGPGVCELLGVRMHAATISQLTATISETILNGGRCIIGCHNLHSIYLFHHDARMRQFYEIADRTHIDGMVLVWLARLLGYPACRDHRVTWLDWLHPLMALAAEKEWRVFYLGSAPGIAEYAAGVLRQQYLGLSIKTRHGYFDVAADGPENRAIREDINAYRPHLLMVGMGQPRQEKWVVENVDHVSAAAILTPGACFDYVAGALPVPWRFLGRIGLEWAFRLATEPRRLGRRYLIEPWSLAPLLRHDLARRIRGRKE
jgi:N-acetylglucosaminyldiphosphoundecaprenol N-acetyl-beta-D-mannosaminyltransferase